MTTIEKIRQEIERRKGYISVTHFAEELLSFLDTLSEEPDKSLEEAFRAEAAKDILCAVLSTPGMWTETTYDGLAGACIRQADELIKQLKEK